MEIRDVIHGAIHIERRELPIVDSEYFQRLRQIKQLGFAEFSFPSATHNRYIHSLGAMETATRAFKVIFRDSIELDLAKELPPAAYDRFLAVLRLAALLHDVGHGPLSHTTEFAMPPVSKLELPVDLGEAQDRKATHEDYTLKIILDSPLTSILERVGTHYGFKPIHVAALIEPKIKIEDGFFAEQINGETVDFSPILHQLISSELDADRMDYLRRDSLSAGVSYGQFDFDWLVGNLTAHIHEQKCFLGLQHRSLYSFEDFLISRFHMFLMVYFHYKAVVYDEMLGQYLLGPDASYSIPYDIEKYIDYNDAHLYSHLATSPSPWAQRIVEKKPYRILVELHSGIPASNEANQRQQQLLDKVKNDLAGQNIHFLECTSTGELSKYFRKKDHPIFVRYDNHYSAPQSIPLVECTNLFERYKEKRSITRLYVSPEDHKKCRHLGRNFSIPFMRPDREEQKSPSQLA